MARLKLFLVRHPDDAATAEPLRSRLEAEGFDVWSEDLLLPGDLVVEEREQALAISAGGIVLISERSLVAWQAASLQVLIRRAVQLKGFVIPVLTAEGLGLPSFLSTREPGRIDQLDTLVEGIRKRLTGVHEMSAPPPSTKQTRLRTNLTNSVRLVGRTDEIAALETWFEDTSRSSMGVLYGLPGTGKTGLAEWWGATHLPLYPGGVFRVAATTSPFDGLVRVAEQVFMLRTEDFSRSGPLSVFEPFASRPTLLIFDNLESESALQMEGSPLLPSVNQPIHVLVTSTAIQWSPQFKRLRLTPLRRPAALALVGVLDDPPTLDDATRDRIVRGFRGYPAVLVPVVMRARRSAAHGRPFRLSGGSKLARAKAEELYQPVWASLEPDAHAALCAAACFRFEDIPEKPCRRLSDLDDERFEEALLTCLESSLLEVTRPSGEGSQWFGMYGLLHDFVRRQAGFEPFREKASELRDELRARIDRKPAPDDASHLIALLPGSPDGIDNALRVAATRSLQTVGLFEEGLRWARLLPEARGDAWADCREEEIACLLSLGRFDKAEEAAQELSRLLDGDAGPDAAPRAPHAPRAQEGRTLLQLGTAMHERGAYQAAEPVLSRSVELLREGDAAGVRDSEHVGLALHTLARGLSQQGKYEEALGHYEEAAAQIRRGDPRGRVDHGRVGVSVHQAGYCLSELRRFPEALIKYEQAASEKKRGGIYGRVDHSSVGSSLYAMGYCLVVQKEHEKAIVKYEEAAAESRLGDVHGRVDHDRVGSSVHQVGYCLSEQKKYREALARYQEAATEKKKGDIYRRVDHNHVGASVHEVGYCLIELDDYVAALKKFEEAASEIRQGDIHGRVDHNRVGGSLHHVGFCLIQSRRYPEALARFEEAAAEMRQGDIYERVDHERVGTSLHRAGDCLSELGQDENALMKYEEAAAAKQRGDVDGRVDAASLARTLERAAEMAERLGRAAEAAGFRARAEETDGGGGGD